MAERPRFFDDLAGVAGGALSALAGVREEAEALVRARVDEAIRKLDLVRREDMEAVQDMASNARAAQEVLEARVAALEAKHAGSSVPGTPVAGTSEVDAAALPRPPGGPGAAVHPAAPEAGASEVTPAAMPPGSAAPGSFQPPV